MISRASHRGFVAALVLAALPVASACSSADRNTQITIALSSETRVPTELDSFTLRVFSTRSGELRFSQDYFPTTGREFPTTLAVIPFDEDSLKSPVRVELEGRLGSASFLRRQSVLSFSEGRNVLLAMPLRMACFQFQTCGANETCAGGQCVKAQIASDTLLDYQPELVFPETATSCFDEQSCLAGSVKLDVAQDCTFALSADTGTNGNGNVSIRWAAAPERILALAFDDAQEGWTRLSADRGRLSQGACDSHFQRRASDGTLLVADWAREVLFSPRCAPKTGRVPYCRSPITQHEGIGADYP